MRLVSRVVEVLRGDTPLMPFLVSRILVLTRLSSLLTIDRDGYTLRFSPSSIGAGLWENPDMFRGEERFLRARMPPAGTFVDVGANVGVLTCAIASQDASGQVIAFEPHPRTFEFLKRNVRLNGLCNVVMHNLALGSDPGVLFISDSRADDMNFISASGTPVHISTLDAVLCDVKRIDVLKIDVEGYELEVLKGGQQTLPRTQEVYFEAFEPLYRRFGYSFADVRALLEDHGFSVDEIDPQTWETKPLTPNFVPVECKNMLARRQG